MYHCFDFANRDGISSVLKIANFNICLKKIFWDIPGVQLKLLVRRLSWMFFLPFVVDLPCKTGNIRDGGTGCFTNFIQQHLSRDGIIAVVKTYFLMIIKRVVHWDLLFKSNKIESYLFYYCSCRLKVIMHGLLLDIPANFDCNPYGNQRWRPFHVVLWLPDMTFCYAWCISK